LWSLLRRVTRRHGAAWKAVDPRGKPFAATFKPPVATFKPPTRGKKKLSKAQQMAQRLQAERVQAEREAAERDAHAEKMRTAQAKSKANRFEDLEKSKAATSMQAMWRGRADRKAAKEREQAARTIGYTPKKAHTAAESARLWPVVRMLFGLTRIRLALRLFSTRCTAQARSPPKTGEAGECSRRAQASASLRKGRPPAASADPSRSPPLRSGRPADCGGLPEAAANGGGGEGGGTRARRSEGTHSDCVDDGPG
jgi:chemotaxis protein histidine kinase CheA